ncbi:MAG TPA: aminoglycoside phosphotransferase family protein [Caulobacteraceae bacterium]|jgi:aminoglycoside phosphotransferase (APT) family kinase protein|nr:aminoglycoside phosphotransferase family protein [Caulobacteraceae bacterium]
MSDAYAQHLAALHAGFEAPPALIDDAAREVTASPVAARQRIVHGEANEVYRITFENGLQAILRIARRNAAVFEKEAWAIGRCRALRMAVPEVLSVQDVDFEGERLALCFLELLPGERLSDSLALPRETLRSVVRELARQLSWMHATRPEDLGAAVRFFENDTDDFLATAPEFVRLGTEAGLQRQALDQAIGAYETVMRRHGFGPRRLTHNDLRACHVLVHGGRLSGIIDFGQVSMDTPINEFAKWDYWEAPALPVAWLREDYADEALFDELFDARFQALRLANALWALRWYALTGYAAGVARAAASIERYVAELRGG